MQKTQTPKKARKASGLTQEQVAHAAGITVRTVSRAETRNRWPVQRRVLTAYRAALGLPVPA